MKHHRNQFDRHTDHVFQPTSPFPDRPEPHKTKQKSFPHMMLVPSYKVFTALSKYSLTINWTMKLNENIYLHTEPVYGEKLWKYCSQAAPLNSHIVYSVREYGHYSHSSNKYDCQWFRSTLIITFYVQYFFTLELNCRMPILNLLWSDYNASVKRNNV